MNRIDNLNSLNYLNVLYERLKRSINEINKKIIDGSVLITMTKLNSNDAFKVMANSSQRFSRVYEEDLSPLKEKGYIKLSEISSISNTYVITALGVYYVEYEKSILDLNKILKFMQEDSLDFPIANKPLNNKEQAILFALIALRTFDEEAMMDLNTEETSAKWEEIINEQLNPFLDKNNIINSRGIFSQKAGHENPVSYIIRRLNDLPKKTRNIFISTNNNQYYLKIDVEDKDEAENQLVYLLGKIFVNIPTIEEAEEIKRFLFEIAQSQSIYVLNNFKFINYDWNKVVNGAIDRIFLGIAL